MMSERKEINERSGRESQKETPNESRKKNEARGKWRKKEEDFFGGTDSSKKQTFAAKVKREYTQLQQVHIRQSKLGNIRAIGSV